jgi:pimeloyl-ACP methyl ester carboxylesterase
LRVARDHPNLVRSVVLGEPGRQAFTLTNPGVAPIFRRELADEVRHAYERGEVERAIQMLTEAVVGKEWAARSGPAWVRRMLLDNAWQLRQFGTRSRAEARVTCEEARRIRAPMLLFGGDHSPQAFRVVLDEIQRCLPASERAVLPESSHGLELDNPSTFNEIVLRFLSRHTGRDH